MGRLNDLICLANAQVGYQEKKNNADLESMKGNAGYSNYTKYARDVNQWGLAGCQGQPWCATYQFWLEVKIFGLEKALSHFHMNTRNYSGYNCFCIYDAFEKAGQVSKNPKEGCLVVFKHSHIGRVLEIRNGRIYTNEGNTSALYGDNNGGTVRNKDYAISDTSILGYCIIDYSEPKTEDMISLESTEKANFEQDPSEETKELVRSRTEAFQALLNSWYPSLLEAKCGGLLEEDGIYGKLTRNAALAVWKDILNRYFGADLTPGDSAFGEKCRAAAGNALVQYGDTGTLVAIAEGILAERGFYTGNIDAIFGGLLLNATKMFQKENDIEEIGMVDAKTWGLLFKE